MRLETERNGTHTVTIPVHSPLKIGTLNSILSGVASHLKISKFELAERLFRK
ncbi:MAG: hypothetical protein ACP5G4_03140 [bacterium]